MKDNIKYSIHNKFDIEVIRDGRVRQRAKAYNMVLDNLFHYIVETTTAFATNIQYGSGTGTIQSSDTSLFNRYSGKGVTQDSLTCDYVNKVITRQVRINLPLTEAVGVNITEVGLAAGSGNGTLTTHAMLQDMNGNPISINKTDTDIINIYATIYCHWDISEPDVTVFHPGAGLQSALTGASNIFGSFTAGVGVDNFHCSSVVTWPKTGYNLSNKTISYAMPRYSQDSANLTGGIGWIIGTGNYDGIGIRKGSRSWSAFAVANESVGTGDGETTEFETKFNEPYNATVYVNGAAQSSSDVTVKKQILNSGYFLSLDVNSDENNFIYQPSANNPNKYPFILYNPYRDAGFKVSLFSCWGYGYHVTYSWKISVSNDMVNWTTINEQNHYYGGGSSSYSGITYNVPSEYQNYKYYKMENLSYGGADGIGVTVTPGNINNIIFNTPPAEGDVITIDYMTDYIPKDADHVLDATVTFIFGEYTE